jgi:hypothetical protein
LIEGEAVDDHPFNTLMSLLTTDKPDFNFDNKKSFTDNIKQFSNTIYGVVTDESVFKELKQFNQVKAEAEKKYQERLKLDSKINEFFKELHKIPVVDRAKISDKNVFKDFITNLSHPLNEENIENETLKTKADNNFLDAIKSLVSKEDTKTLSIELIEEAIQFIKKSVKTAGSKTAAHMNRSGTNPDLKKDDQSPGSDQKTRGNQSPIGLDVSASGSEEDNSHIVPQTLFEEGNKADLNSTSFTSHGSAGGYSLYGSKSMDTQVNPINRGMLRPEPKKKE